MQIAGYKIVAHIGSGGMGDVYKGYHPGLNRVAAIKTLHQKDGAERFKNEAYIQASVSHPNIARLYDYVITGSTPCIIMEYVEGEALNTYLQKKGRLASEECEAILLQIVSALNYLHQKDIIHRDIKPQNFKIERGETIKMLDFGIAKNKYTPKLTQQGFVVGTTEYMAPEQFQNGLEKKSDIWSLGVMAYEMLTGYMPFEATNPISLRAKIIKGSFTNPKLLVQDASQKLELLIDKCLRINPTSRPSAEEIEQLLRGRQNSSKNRRNAIKEKFTKTSDAFKVSIGFLIALFLIIGFYNKNTGDEETYPPDEDTIATSSDLRTVKINVPSVDHAMIVFPNGLQKELPSEINGREGENILFTIKADGYEDKLVELKINTRRRSYEYNLDKKN